VCVSGGGGAGGGSGGYVYLQLWGTECQVVRLQPGGPAAGSLASETKHTLKMRTDIHLHLRGQLRHIRI